MPPKNINVSQIYKNYQWITTVNQEQVKKIIIVLSIISNSECYIKLKYNYNYI